MVLKAALLLWAASGVAIAIRWRDRPVGERLSAVSVLFLALIAGTVAAVALGLGCFHCSGPAALGMVYGGAMGVGAAVWFLGRVLSLRLLRSRGARRSTMVGIGSAAAGAMTALVIWIVLFSQATLIAAPRYPSLERALPAAEDALGRHRWPGASVHLHRRSPELAEVERRWLGLVESELEIRRISTGWDVGEPLAGPGRALQALIACVVPGALVVWVLIRRFRPAPKAGSDHLGLTGRP